MYSGGGTEIVLLFCQKIVASDGTSDASTFRSIVFTETDTSGDVHDNSLVDLYA